MPKVPPSRTDRDQSTRAVQRARAERRGLLCRYPWLAGDREDTIGVRLPELTPAAASVLEAVGCVAATSANDPGGRDPLTLGDVPQRLRDACPSLDEGPLPGVPSTVVDLTGPEPRVLREGAVPADEAVARVRAARGQ